MMAPHFFFFMLVCQRQHQRSRVWVLEWLHPGNTLASASVPDLSLFHHFEALSFHSTDLSTSHSFHSLTHLRTKKRGAELILTCLSTLFFNHCTSHFFCLICTYRRKSWRKALSQSNCQDCQVATKRMLSNCRAKQAEIPGQLYPVSPAHVWYPSLSLPALMGYNLDLKRPQIILCKVQEFNFLWLHLMYLKNTFQEIFKKRLLIQQSFKWYPIQVTEVNWRFATLKLSLKSCLTLFSPATSWHISSTALLGLNQTDTFSDLLKVHKVKEWKRIREQKTAKIWCIIMSTLSFALTFRRLFPVRL